MKLVFRGVVEGLKVVVRKSENPYWRTLLADGFGIDRGDFIELHPVEALWLADKRRLRVRLGERELSYDDLVRYFFSRDQSLWAEYFTYHALRNAGYPVRPLKWPGSKESSAEREHRRYSTLALALSTGLVVCALCLALLLGLALLVPDLSVAISASAAGLIVALTHTSVSLTRRGQVVGWRYLLPPLTALASLLLNCLLGAADVLSPAVALVCSAIQMHVHPRTEGGRGSELFSFALYRRGESPLSSEPFAYIVVVEALKEVPIELLERALKERGDKDAMIAIVDEHGDVVFYVLEEVLKAPAQLKIRPSS